MKTLLSSVFPVLAAGITVCHATQPTNLEQYMLELINRARANGNAEATRLGMGTLNSDSPSIFGEAWTIQPTAPPVVWNEQLGTAARNQAQLLFNNNFLGGDPHNFGGTSPAVRIASAGFSHCAACPQTHTTSNFIPGVENFGFAGSSIAHTSSQLISETENIHNLLFRDTTTEGRLHRITIMHTFFRELGVGMVTGTIGGGGRIYAMMDFGTASPGSQIFLTGVIYSDTVTANSFYTPGEGLGGIKVQARQNGTVIAETTTYASGGYRLPLAAGAYQIRLVNAAGSISERGAVSLNAENVKLDAVSPGFTTPPVGPVNLRIRRAGNTVIITWDDPAYTLVSSASPSGPWTAAAGTSPATITLQSGKRFFRAQK